MTYPAGEARRITNDAIRYERISALANGKMFAVPRRESISSIWTLDLDSGTAVQRTAENPNLLGVMGMTALPDGRLLLTKVDSPRIDLWITDVDGKNETRLSNEDAHDTSPAINSDGRLIVFASKRDGSKRIWRMDIDGQNRRQLSDESEEVDDNPKILADNRTVVFTRAKAGYRSRLMKTSIDGGPSEPLVSAPTDILDYAGVSRDGKYLSYWSQVWDAKENIFNSTQKVLRIDGEKFIPTDLSFKADRRPYAASEWTADNRLLFQTTADLSNIYVVSINGGAPKKLTDFSSGTIQWYALSADGKTVFIVRGIDTNDIFLLRDTSGL
jgi:Tol biopolymer transport system component